VSTSRFPATLCAVVLSSPQEGEAGILHYSLQITLSVLKGEAQFFFHFTGMKLVTVLELFFISLKIREGIAGYVLLQGILGTGKLDTFWKFSWSH